MKYLILFAFICLCNLSNAQFKTVYLKTPGINCEDCETYVETNLARISGITEADVNPWAKRTKIVFLASRISFEEVKYAIADLGFIADDILPEIVTFKNMPACCRDAAKKTYDLAKAESLKPKVVQPIPTPKKMDTVKTSPKPILPVKPTNTKQTLPAKPLKPTATKTLSVGKKGS